MRFGLHTGQHLVAFGELLDLWRSAERWGFDACYLFDHFVPLHSDVESFLPEEADRAEGSCLEATTALAALARAVPRIGVGVMVCGVGYRPGAQLAQAVSTVASAAPRRVEVGLGAGWFEPEYRAFGLPFPPARDRLEQLEKALPAIASTGARLWVAGTGERRLIPLAARLADSWNAMYLTPEEFRSKVEVLDAACLEAGRDPAAVERSIALGAFCSRDGGEAVRGLTAWALGRGRRAERAAARSLVGTPAQCTEQIRRYAEAGATHVTIMVHPPYDLEGLRLLTNEVFPAFR